MPVRTKNPPIGAAGRQRNAEIGVGEKPITGADIGEMPIVAISQSSDCAFYFSFLDYPCTQVWAVSTERPVAGRVLGASGKMRVRHRLSGEHLGSSSTTDLRAGIIRASSMCQRYLRPSAGGIGRRRSVECRAAGTFDECAHVQRTHADSRAYAVPCTHLRVKTRRNRTAFPVAIAAQGLSEFVAKESRTVRASTTHLLSTQRGSGAG